jgi:hypothetical protein
LLSPCTQKYNFSPQEAGNLPKEIEIKGKCYRSEFIGPPNYTKLCFTEIEWEKDGAFRIIKPSIQAFE